VSSQNIATKEVARDGNLKWSKSGISYVDLTIFDDERPPPLKKVKTTAASARSKDTSPSQDAAVSLGVEDTPIVTRDSYSWRRSTSRWQLEYGTLVIRQRVVGLIVHRDLILRVSLLGHHSTRRIK
jgi:hypothetical protein